MERLATGRELVLKQVGVAANPHEIARCARAFAGYPSARLARKTRHAKHRTKAPTNQLPCIPLFDVGGRRGLAKPLRRTCLNRPTRFEHHSGLPRSVGCS